MPLEDRKIENAFKFAIRDIHSEISTHNIDVKIKAIQFLLPDSHLLSGKIQRYLYCEPETSVNFEKAVIEFVYKGGQSEGTEPERSLYYLKFRDPFKYECYCETSDENLAGERNHQAPPSIQLNPEIFDLSNFNLATDRAVEVPLEVRERLRDLRKIKEYWTEWHNILKRNNLGRSTLWTYILIRKEDDQGSIDEVISSAFIVFDGCLKSYEKSHKLQSISNKRIQDALYKLTLDLFNLEIYRQATRAAVAQVMARNMSHNIGSHVLSRIEAPSGNQYKGFPLNEFAEESTTDKDKRLTSIFFSYLKSRMDFLADITTGVPTIENSKWFFKEILSGIDKNRLLLDRISGIGDFYFQIKTVSYIENPSGVEITEKENDLMVSVPNDVLGCHAFYTLIENIIRNCAKHGGKGDKGKSSGNPLNIWIKIKECKEEKGNEYYELIIYDDGKDLRNEKPIIIGDEEIKKYHKHFESVEFTNEKSIKPLDKLVFDQNHRINQSVLKNGSLRQGAWGLIEMDASAAYLRKIPIEQIDEDFYDINLDQTQEAKKSYYPKKGINPENLNILKAIAVDDSFLGYRLLLYKPREILIIDNIGFYKNISLERRKELLKSGILVCDFQGSENYFVFNSKKIYNHKLVLLLSDEPDNILKNDITGLSRRILKISTSDSENLLDLKLSTDTSNFKKQLWKLYIERSNYSFYRSYSGFEKSTFIKEKIINKSSGLKANYFDHGDGYKDSKIDFKEIKYGAVDGFMPAGDEIKSIQFIESVHNKIVVIDERIQEYAEFGDYKPKNGNKIKINDIYQHTNIYVPNKEKCNLGKQNFDDEFSKILAIFKEQDDACFFVIHLGVIEKLIGSHNKKEEFKRKYNKDISKEIRNFLDDLICSPNKIDYNKLIIISGRGTPHNLPPNTRYLNYSIISQYMIDMRFKYLLSEAVFSSRKIKSQ